MPYFRPAAGKNKKKRTNIGISLADSEIRTTLKKEKQMVCSLKTHGLSSIYRLFMFDL